MRLRRRTVIGGLGAALGLSTSSGAVARALARTGDNRHATLSFDARGAGLHPQRTPALAKWGGAGPNGRLSANTCYLEIDGKPMPVVAGELHIQRVPPEEWETAILQMKAAGLNTVSSYVFWNQIEESRGNFGFTGRNDLRAFFALCQRHGMMAILRPGPFTNAEFLLGGLPIWLFGMPTTERSNDALYLQLVETYFAALADNLKGLFWKDGGPIFIVQLENELSVAPIGWQQPYLRAAPIVGHTGPTGEAFTRHYRELHRIALSSGLGAPFYSATSWGTNEELPIDILMPTYGGYMDLVPSGPDNSPLTIFDFDGKKYDDKVPVGFVEIGYGTPIRDKFRPHPSPDAGYASTLTLFGASRALMLGYYMFRGGSNPVNGVAGWTTKDTVFPLISYDFRAPIGEFGDWREALYRARPMNLLLRNFAGALARAEPIAARDPVVDPTQDRVRGEARFDGESGFVFVSNFANVNPLSDRANFSVEVTTDDDMIRIPARGSLTLPSGMMAIWPINLDLSAGMTLRSATAQPLCQLSQDGVRWIALSQNGNLPVEIVLAGPGLADVRTNSADSGPEVSDGRHVMRVKPGRGSVVHLQAKDGTEVKLLVLSERDAQRAALLGPGDRPFLAISDAIVTATAAEVSLASRDAHDLIMSVFPDRSATGVARRAEKEGVFMRHTAKVKPRKIAADVTMLSQDRAVVKLSASQFEALENIFMDISYIGDVCRIFHAGTGALLADDMNDGLPWAVGLSRFRDILATDGIVLRAEPEIAGETPSVATAAGATMTLGAVEKATGQDATIVSIVFAPVYRAKIPLT